MRMPFYQCHYEWPKAHVRERHVTKSKRAVTVAYSSEVTMAVGARTGPAHTFTYDTIDSCEGRAVPVEI